MTRLPHVLLVVLDTVRADALGVYGCPRPTSPRIDRLAASAVVYRRAHSPSCWTLPAHASLFTGLAPSQHGVGGARDGLVAVGAPTLAERLRDHGYATLGASANPWIGPAFGFDRGFDEFLCGWHVGAAPDIAAASLAHGGHTARQKLAAVAAGGPASLIAALPNYAIARRRRAGRFGARGLSRRFLAAFARAARDGPVFGFVNLLDAHHPHSPPRRHLQVLGGSLGRVPTHPWALAGGLATLTDADRAALRRLYEADVRHADDVAGGLVAAVDRLSQRPVNVVVTADHGENLGEHGLMDHQFSLHQTLLHVPLVVRMSGGEPADEPSLVSLCDVFELLAAGRRPRPRTSVTAEYARPQPPVQRLQTRWPEGRFDHLDRRLRALVRDDGMKAIWASDGRHEAYDLRVDPGEAENLWPSAAAEALLAELEERFGTAEDAAQAPPPAADTAVRNALESLGYL